MAPRREEHRRCDDQPTTYRQVGLASNDRRLKGEDRLLANLRPGSLSGAGTLRIIKPEYQARLT
jgi:hypothetical protein